MQNNNEFNENNLMMQLDILKYNTLEACLKKINTLAQFDLAYDSSEFSQEQINNYLWIMRDYTREALKICEEIK